MIRDIDSKVKEIKLVVLDLKGTLIDSCNPEEIKELFAHLKKFSEKIQGLGLSACLITSSESNPLVEYISEAGFMDVLHSCLNKIQAAETLINKYQVTFENLFYFADDILDVPLLTKAGLSAAPSTASRSVKRYADIIIEEESAGKKLDHIFELFKEKRLPDNQYAV